MAVPLTTGQLRRTVQLLRLPAGTLALSAEGVVRRAAGQDRDKVSSLLRARSAARTRRVLGELKGGALKAGQLLSTVEALLPPDPEQTWRYALAGLQAGNQPVPFAEIEPLLVTELGPAWRGLFQRFDEQAAAAASIGQVHHAVWADGREVAVKVQYPGVREALAADLRTVSVLTRAAALVARGMSLPPLVRELRERLVEELDYEREAASQERFRLGVDASEVLVPAVVRATPRVLVQELVLGTPLSEVARTGSQQQRDLAAGLYQRFLVSGPERVGLLHTDPHPGNFLMQGDRLVALDFGSVLPLAGMPPAFGSLLAALLSEDAERVLPRLREAGFVRPDRVLDTDKLIDIMAPFTVPARHEQFTFSRDWLRGQFARVNDPRNPELAVAMQLDLPAEQLFTHRVWLGMVGVLCQLEVTVPVAPVLRRWLPGFAEAPAVASDP